MVAKKIAASPTTRAHAKTATATLKMIACITQNVLRYTYNI